MIIGIDVSAVVYGTGVSNYTLNLVKNLVKIDKQNTYKLFFSSLRQSLPKELASLSRQPNVKIFHFKLPPTFWEWVWNRFRIIPIEILIGRCHVFHTWDWLEPPVVRAKLVTTIHDLVPLLYPKWQHPKTVDNFKRKLKLAIRHKSFFICVSESTKNDFLNMFPRVSKTKVILEAAEDKYSQFLKQEDQTKQKKLLVIKKQYGLDKYLLAQGTREPRKNLKRLIEAFCLYKKNHPSSKLELAITGKYGWGEDVDHLKSPWVKILGYIPEKDMVALHAAAMALVVPSLYEGFGLGILKSMKVGVPVITSNVSSLPEVAGNAAILVDPNNTLEIAKAITKVAGSTALRKKLSEKGLIQASKFSWEKMAKETLEVYKSL